LTIIIKPHLDYQIIQDGDSFFLYEFLSGGGALIAKWNRGDKISFAELRCDPVCVDSISFPKNLMNGKSFLMELYYGGILE